MTPVSGRAAVFSIGGVQFVIRPAGVLLFGGIAAALDLTFLPLALPGQTPLTYHLAALAMMAAMIVTTLLHESGHALAYRAQGIWPVRITLRGSGGACAAVIYADRDTPARALVRALAGPAATLLVVLTLVTLWHAAALPALWRLCAAALTLFSLGDLLFNTLPVHPRCDGTHALRAVLWLARGHEPERHVVLYLWRPLVLAAAVLSIAWCAERVGWTSGGWPLHPIASGLALALCAVPPLCLAYRSWQRRELAIIT